MASFTLRHFCNPKSIQSIQPRTLFAFLRRFASYFSQHDVAIPDDDRVSSFDYDRLIELISNPFRDTPRELLDALFLVDELSSDDAMDEMLLLVREHDLVLEYSAEQTPIDIAIQVWLLKPRLLDEVHAVFHAMRPKNFEYFQTARAAPPVFQMPTTKKLRKLELELGDWFGQRRRGSICRVFLFPSKDEVRMLIRHGETIKREETIEDSSLDKSNTEVRESKASLSSICFRPLRYDVVVYDMLIGELRINAKLKGEKKIYCQKIGEHMFGDPECFPGVDKYTLEPLRELGEDALSCGDIEGIEWIKLVEVAFYWGGKYQEIENRKAADFFAAAELRDARIPDAPRLTKATFRIKFESQPTPRSIRISPANVAQFARDDDAVLIERWLQLRGFVKNRLTQELDSNHVESNNSDLARA